MSSATTNEFNVYAELGLDGGVTDVELQLLEPCMDELFQQVIRRVAMDGEE